MSFLNDIRELVFLTQEAQRVILAVFFSAHHSAFQVQYLFDHAFTVDASHKILLVIPIAVKIIDNYN